MVVIVVAVAELIFNSSRNWSKERKGKGGEVEVKSLAHRVILTTPETSLKHLLETFKRRRKHMAVVMDTEHKKPLGICTLEDVLEVIFGPIHEESLSDDELNVDDLMLEIGKIHNG